jgi:hypothetical protein
MRLSDITLLVKKIWVGILVTLIPLGILAGGLWLTQRTLAGHSRPETNRSAQVQHEN